MRLPRGLPPGHATPLRGLGLAPAGVLFAILVAHAILETARDALFLARLGPHRLASAYLAMAGCAVLAVIGLRRLGIREPRRMLIRVLGLATLGTGAIAVAIAGSRAAVFVLYVWTGFIITLVVPSFWVAIDRVARITEAKRAFGLISAGGVLGAMVGSAIAGALGHLVAAHHLVVFGAAAFGLATVAAAVLVPRGGVAEPPVRASRVEIQSRHARRYVRLLLALGVISTVVLTLGDLTFKRVLAERVSADALAPTLGMIYTGLNAIALVIQVIVTPRLLARWGVGRTLTVLPLILVTSAAGFALTGAMIAVIALKLGDGGLRHSLHRVGSELLYLPLPSAVRDGGKLIADAVGQRGGQALAALILLGLAALGTTARGVAAVTALVGVAWLVATVVARRAYLQQFRDSLQLGEIQRDVAIPALDADSLRVLLDLVASPNEVEALAALDLLARRARVPRQAFEHPHEAVVRHALALLGGELPPDVLPVLARLREHPVPAIRAAALAAAARARGDHGLLARALGEADPHVRAVGLIGLAASGADAATLAELARVLRFVEDPRLRGDVRRVFLAAGERGLAFLIASFDDPRTPHGVYRHLPRTISRFRSTDAAAALATRLTRGLDSSIELKILRALGRMRTDDPGLVIDRAPIRAYVRTTVAQAARYATFGDAFVAGAPPAASAARLICELLEDKRRIAVERAFRGLGILHPRAGLRSAHRALIDRDDARRAAAREIVEATVAPEVREALLAVIDPLPAAVRRARLGHLAPGPFAHPDDLITALLADPSESLRCVVAQHVADERLTGLRGALAELRPRFGPPLVIHAFDQAIARLDV